MKRLVNAGDLSHEEWLAYRRKGIGGSDAAAVAGLNPWKSPVSVYMDKIGESKPTQDNERMRIGRDLEDYVARRFEEATGKKVRRNNFMMVHDDYNFMVANIDREIIGENAILECKTTNSYSKSDWEDGKIPIHYEIQCHHYMMVTGAEKAYIACLIGNEAFVWYEIKRDEETIQMLMDLEKDFWERYVMAGEVPPPDGSDDYDNILKERFANSSDDIIEFSKEEADAISRLDELKGLIKDLEIEKKLHEQTLKVSLKKANTGICDGRKVTWKEQTRLDLDKKKLKEEMPEIYKKYEKESTYRVLRIK